MKKISMLGAAALLLFPLTVQAADYNPSEFESKFSNYYASKMFVSDLNFAEQAGITTIKFPETEVWDFEFDKEGNVVEKKDIIPSYTMTAVVDGNFGGYPRYKISADSNDAFRAEVYRRFALNGLNSEGFSEEIFFVPHFDFISGINIKSDKVVISELDRQTGLKDEVASVHSLEFKSDMTPVKDEAIYNINWKTGNISFKSPFVSVSVPSVSSEATAVYEIDAQTDYAKLLTDGAAIKKSASLFSAENILISLFTGSTSNLSIRATAKINRDDTKGMMNMSGHSDIYGIKIPDIQEFSLQQIKFLYKLEDVSVAQIRKMQKIYEKLVDMQETLRNHDNQELNPDEKAIIREVGDILDEISKTAQLKLQFNVKFAGGDVIYALGLKKKGKYIVGNGKVKIYNLDKIIPDYAKQCEEEQRINPSTVPMACMKAGMTGFFDEYIDKSKRTVDNKGQTVDTINIVFNETGIYVKGEKVSDPIEFDIKEIFSLALSEQN